MTSTKQVHDIQHSQEWEGDEAKSGNEERLLENNEGNDANSLGEEENFNKKKEYSYSEATLLKHLRISLYGAKTETSSEEEIKDLEVISHLFFDFIEFAYTSQYLKNL